MFRARPDLHPNGKETILICSAGICRTSRLFAVPVLTNIHATECTPMHSVAFWFSASRYYPQPPVQPLSDRIGILTYYFEYHSEFFRAYRIDNALRIASDAESSFQIQVFFENGNTGPVTGDPGTESIRIPQPCLNRFRGNLEHRSESRKMPRTSVPLRVHDRPYPPDELPRRPSIQTVPMSGHIGGNEVPRSPEEPRKTLGNEHEKKLRPQQSGCSRCSRKGSDATESKTIRRMQSVRLAQEGALPAKGSEAGVASGTESIRIKRKTERTNSVPA